MRTAFLPYVFAAAAVSAPISDAIACSKQAISSRVRADVIIDLQSGHQIYSNLNAVDLAQKQLDPASLTKVEGVKEIIRRVWSGVWTKDTKFNVSNRPREASYVRDVGAIARMSMVTSFNVMDQIARNDPTFMDGVRDSVRRLGMNATEYLSPTGDPDASRDVRARHRTTAGDLLISIRDYHLHYAQSSRVERAFGSPSLSGSPSIDDIPHIHRSLSTVTLLQNAVSPKAKPVEGVTDGKTAYSCAAGFGSYLKYDFNQRSFIILTLGHATGAERDAHSRHLIETNKDGMAAFRPIEEPAPAMLPTAALK